MKIRSVAPEETVLYNGKGIPDYVRNLSNADTETDRLSPEPPCHAPMRQSRQVPGDIFDPINRSRCKEHLELHRCSAYIGIAVVNLEQAKKVSQRIAQMSDPFCIVAFGSVATRGWGNDLDLLIVTEDLEGIHRQLAPFYKELALDPFVVNREQIREKFLKGSPFLRQIQKTGRCLYMKDSVKIWKTRAEEDFKTAQYLLQGNYYRSACYHAQQAVEKSIKGALIQKGWDLEKIHSIERLVAIGEGYGIDPGISEDDQVLIDSIYRGRYPAEEGLLPTGDPTRPQSEQVVRLAGQVLQRLFRPGDRTEKQG